MAVHDRPAAFEGSDGVSYSVEIMVEQSLDEPAEWGAFLFFVKWSRIGAQSPEGHLESPILASADTAEDARRVVGAMSLGEVKGVLDRLIAERAIDQAGPGSTPTRRWWDAMHDADPE